MAEPEADAPDVSETAAAADEPVATEAASELSAEDNARLEAMMIDLRWLITEGYVTEYGDGMLLAPPPMPEAKKKDVLVEAKLTEAVAPTPAVEVEEPKAEPDAGSVEAKRRISLNLFGDGIGRYHSL